MKPPRLPLLRLAALACALFGDNAHAAQGTPATVAFTVAAPETVMSSARMKDLGIREFDTGIYRIAEREQSKWFSTCSKVPEGQTLAVGTLDEPFALVAERGVEFVGLPNRRLDRDQPGNFGWFAGIHDLGNGQVLAFIHTEESVVARGDQGRRGVYFRFGLALSGDGGRHWKWLGYIMEPNASFRDWYTGAKGNLNVGYANVIVHDGWFRLYYRDNRVVGDRLEDGVAVMRARVDDVVRSAQAGRVGVWHKYHEGDWREPGLGGRFTPLNIPTRGLMHGDAAYNTFLGRFIIVTRGSKWEDVRQSEIQLTTSVDGLVWSDWQILFQDPHLNDYPTIVSTGDDNEITGQEFYVYFLKHHDRVMPGKFGEVRFDRIKVRLDDRERSAAGTAVPAPATP
jgi:hypothetical protein